MAYRIRSYVYDKPHQTEGAGAKTFRWETVETGLTRQQALELAKQLESRHPLERFRVTEDAA